MEGGSQRTYIRRQQRGRRLLQLLRAERRLQQITQLVNNRRTGTSVKSGCAFDRPLTFHGSALRACALVFAPALNETRLGHLEISLVGTDHERCEQTVACDTSRLGQRTVVSDDTDTDSTDTRTLCGQATILAHYLCLKADGSSSDSAPSDGKNTDLKETEAYCEDQGVTQTDGPPHDQHLGLAPWVPVASGGESTVPKEIEKFCKVSASPEA